MKISKNKTSIITDLSREIEKPTAGRYDKLWADIVVKNVTDFFASDVSSFLIVQQLLMSNGTTEFRIF